MWECAAGIALIMGGAIPGHSRVVGGITSVVCGVGMGALTCMIVSNSCATVGVGSGMADPSRMVVCVVIADLSTGGVGGFTGQLNNLVMVAATEGVPIVGVSGAPAWIDSMALAGTVVRLGTMGVVSAIACLVSMNEAQFVTRLIRLGVNIPMLFCGIIAALTSLGVLGGMAVPLGWQCGRRVQSRCGTVTVCCYMVWANLVWCVAAMLVMAGPTVIVVIHLLYNRGQITVIRQALLRGSDCGRVIIIILIVLHPGVWWLCYTPIIAAFSGISIFIILWHGDDGLCGTDAVTMVILAVYRIQGTHISRDVCHGGSGVEGHCCHNTDTRVLVDGCGGAGGQKSGGEDVGLYTRVAGSRMGMGPGLQFCCQATYCWGRNRTKLPYVHWRMGIIIHFIDTHIYAFHWLKNPCFIIFIDICVGVFIISIETRLIGQIMASYQTWSNIWHLGYMRVDSIQICHLMVLIWWIFWLSYLDNHMPYTDKASSHWIKVVVPNCLSF